MKGKILWLGLSFLLVAALVLAACAGPTVPGEQEEEEVVPVDEEEEKEEEEVVVPAEGEPQRGETLTVINQGFTTEPKSWDANCSGWTGTERFIGPYQEHVLAGDVSKGLTGTGEFPFGGRYVPLEFRTGGVAESWELLADPLRIIFHIEPGIMWQAKEGVMEARELTAYDVEYAWNRYRGHAKTDPTRWEFVGQIEATDKYTLVCPLLYVYPDWPYVIAWGPYGAVAPRELVEAGIEDWRNAVGTGPFMLTNYVSGSFIEYSSSPTYRGKTIIDGKEYQIPFVDKLVLPVIKDEATMLAILRTGKADIWERAAWQYKDTLNTGNPELREWEVGGWHGYAVHLRQDIGPPFDMLQVRRAMNMAIDKQKIIDTVYGGYGVMLNFPIAATVPETTYTPLAKCPEAVQELYEYNPEKAKELMVAAGYPDGFKAECVFQAKALDTDVISLVADFWSKNLNIELELKPIDSAAVWGMKTGKLHKHMFGAFDAGPTPSWGVGSDWLEGRLENISMWADPTFEDLITRWQTSTSVEEQDSLIKQANLRILEDTPAIILPGYNHFRYAWPWVRNYEGEAASNYQISTNLYAISWIDQDMKADMGY